MNEKEIQAAKLLKCKDQAAKEFKYRNFLHLLRYESVNDFSNVIDRAMQLYAAQCVTDERERVRKAMPSEREISIANSEAFNTSHPADKANWFYGFKRGVDYVRDRLSQLIERGEG